MFMVMNRELFVQTNSDWSDLYSHTSFHKPRLLPGNPYLFAAAPPSLNDILQKEKK